MDNSVGHDRQGVTSPNVGFLYSLKLQKQHLVSFSLERLKGPVTGDPGGALVSSTGGDTVGQPAGHLSR